MKKFAVIMAALLVAAAFTGCGSLRTPTSGARAKNVYYNTFFGVTIEGAQYGLTEGTLSAGFPLGVSNHFTGQETKVSVKNGSLLLLWDRKNGLPNR